MSKAQRQREKTRRQRKKEKHRTALVNEGRLKTATQTDPKTGDQFAVGFVDGKIEYTSKPINGFTHADYLAQRWLRHRAQKLR